jgi:transcriptional regulator with XRE-family HTH domain
MDELATRSGVNKSTISRIEAGEITNPSNDTVAKLELALRLRRGTLVFGHPMEKSA